jgi:uncharacterized protein with PQ loop repeat
LQDGGFARILVSRRKAVAMGLVTLSPTRKRIMLTHALGCLAAALSMSLAWPQVFKSCVQRRTSGLSATASTLGVAMPIGWITYGLLSGDRIQVVTNTVTGLTGLAILLALLITQPQLRNLRALRVSGGSAAAVIAAALLSGASAALPGVRSSQAGEVLGLLLAGVSFLSAIPQPLALLRDRNQDLSGLSPLRWRLAALVGLISASIVCTVLYRRREPAAVVVIETFEHLRWRDSITTRNLAMAGV